ncbi:hypothetical protein MKEN_00148300 [Mycena kentingensis (nom. inval.)]|nr:hypothetical protein MKEN_00148300 [Mycena kentingensis (nom. inval.)]
MVVNKKSAKRAPSSRSSSSSSEHGAKRRKTADTSNRKESRIDKASPAVALRRYLFFQSVFLGRCLCWSASMDPRHLEAYIYGFWTMLLCNPLGGNWTGLIRILQPQWPIWSSTKDLSKRLADTSFLSTVTTPDKDARGKYVDFAIVIVQTAPRLDPLPHFIRIYLHYGIAGMTLNAFFDHFLPNNLHLQPSLLRVVGLLAPIMLELKLGPPRHAVDLWCFHLTLSNLFSEGQEQAEQQALSLWASWRFRGQVSLISVAVSGDYMRLRRSTRKRGVATLKQEISEGKRRPGGVDLYDAGDAESEGSSLHLERAMEDDASNTSPQPPDSERNASERNESERNESIPPTTDPGPGSDPSPERIAAARATLKRLLSRGVFPNAFTADPSSALSSTLPHDGLNSSENDAPTPSGPSQPPNPTSSTTVSASSDAAGLPQDLQSANEELLNICHYALQLQQTNEKLRASLEATTTGAPVASVEPAPVLWVDDTAGDVSEAEWDEDEQGDNDVDVGAAADSAIDDDQTAAQPVASGSGLRDTRSHPGASPVDEDDADRDADVVAAREDLRERLAGLYKQLWNLEASLPLDVGAIDEVVAQIDGLELTIAEEDLDLDTGLPNSRFEEFEELRNEVLEAVVEVEKAATAAMQYELEVKNAQEYPQTRATKNTSLPPRVVAALDDHVNRLAAHQEQILAATKHLQRVGRNFGLKVPASRNPALPPFSDADLDLVHRSQYREPCFETRPPSVLFKGKGEVAWSRVIRLGTDIGDLFLQFLEEEIQRHHVRSGLGLVVALRGVACVLPSRSALRTLVRDVADLASLAAVYVSVALALVWIAFNYALSPLLNALFSLPKSDAERSGRELVPFWKFGPVFASVPFAAASTIRGPTTGFVLGTLRVILHVAARSSTVLVILFLAAFLLGLPLLILFIIVKRLSVDPHRRVWTRRNNVAADLVINTCLFILPFEYAALLLGRQSRQVALLAAMSKWGGLAAYTLAAVWFFCDRAAVYFFRKAIPRLMLTRKRTKRRRLAQADDGTVQWLRFVVFPAILVLNGFICSSDTPVLSNVLTLACATALAFTLVVFDIIMGIYLATYAVRDETGKTVWEKRGWEYYPEVGISVEFGQAGQWLGAREERNERL